MDRGRGGAPRRYREARAALLGRDGTRLYSDGELASGHADRLGACGVAWKVAGLAEEAPAANPFRQPRRFQGTRRVY